MAGSLISRQDAHDMVERFINNKSVVVNTPHGFLYDFNLIQQLMEDNPGATGIRVYTGLDENNQMCTILVATDSNGNNLYNGALPCLDNGEACPPQCSNPAL